MIMLLSIRAVWLLSVLFAYAGARSSEENYNKKTQYGENNGTIGTKLQEDTRVPATRMKKPESEGLHIKKRDANQGHEDLLELMVRIAETPEEWDRIHRILNELGRDENRQRGKESNVVGVSSVLTAEEENRKNPVTFNNPRSSITQNAITYQSIKKNGEPQVNTTAPSYANKSINKRKHKATDESYESSSDDSWPDFDEAIWNKKRWHFLPKVKVGDENPFTEKWSDTEYTSKQHLRHTKYDRDEQNNDESNEVSDILDDMWDYNSDTNVNKDDNLWKDVGDSITQVVQPDENRNDVKNISQKIAVIAENVTNMWMSLNSTANKSRSNRPNFVYHRVTSNPRERHKINAYIAVSVVRESKTSLQSSPTTAPTEAPWNHARHLHKLQEQLKSISAVKAKLRHHWLDKEYQHAQLSRGRYGHQHNLQNRTQH